MVSISICGVQTHPSIYLSVCPDLLPLPPSSAMDTGLPNMPASGDPHPHQMSPSTHTLVSNNDRHPDSAKSPPGDDWSDDTDGGDAGHRSNASLKQQLTRILTCINLAPSSSNQPKAHLLSKPVILHSGYSICSSCYESNYNNQHRHPHPHPHPHHDLHSLPPLPSATAHPPSTHPELAQPGPGPGFHPDQDPEFPSINFLIQKVIQILKSSVDDDIDDSRRIELALRAELECPLCAQLLNSPTTTSCGHTFCLSCLLRARDHSIQCPVCRRATLSDRQTVPPIDISLDRVLFKCFGPDLQSSGSNNRTVPLLVCSIGFPTMPMFLQILEPTHQVMIRRALATNNTIGVVIPAFNHLHHSHDQNHNPYSVKVPVTDPTQPNLPVHQYGTIFEIIKCETLIDGTLLVESRGLSRFRVRYLSGQLDGYLVAKVQVFHDSLVEDERPEERAKIDSLIRTCKEFIEVLKSGCTPWIIERVENTFGSMPDDPVRFSYWIAMLLPISDQQKADLLPITSCRVRLTIVVGWIEILKAQWRVRGCSII